MMKPSLFISYSRQEAPFVDNLLDKLEDAGFRVWMDYHSLTPARPWMDEIYRGIAEADAVLFVVSKNSMASVNVGAELMHSIRLRKRIILIIFEAMRLPPQLAGYEWVDFRGSFPKALAELMTQLLSPVPKQWGPPQRGIKAPLVVWLSFLTSLIVSLISLTLFWTLYIPYYLAPLPYRILKRDYSFFHVRASLIIAPFAIFMTGMLLIASQMEEMLTLLFILPLFIGVPFILLLLLFIHLPDMRRWGKPVAVRPRFANRYLPNNPRPRPVKFTIDAAEEDGKYANDIFRGLTKYNHQYVEDAAQAEAIFVLLSRYKKSTAYDPEKQNVYLVIIQTVKDIDRKLQRIQWIDFRRGMKNLDALAQLLPEPARLFKALGISPMGNQLTLPPIIQALVYFLTFFGLLTLSSWIIFAIQMNTSISVPEAALIIPLVGASIGMTFLTARSLINRTGIMASLRNLILLILFLFLFLTGFQFHITLHYQPLVRDETSKNIILVWVGFAYVAGLIIMSALALWYINDLRRWFPNRRGGIFSSFLRRVMNPGL